MENKYTDTIRGDEFGLFDYHELNEKQRIEKWMVIALIIEEKRVASNDVATIFRNNPFFFDWYKRTILADTPISETYH